MEAEKLKEILNLSKEEKIELVQTLWDSISAGEDNPEIPKEHIKILKERLNRIDSGETRVRDWEEVKKKYFKFDDLQT